MRANQSDRLAAETEEQREARLQRMCANQSDRLAAECHELRVTLRIVITTAQGRSLNT